MPQTPRTLLLLLSLGAGALGCTADVNRGVAGGSGAFPGAGAGADAGTAGAGATGSGATGSGATGSGASSGSGGAGTGGSAGASSGGTGGSVGGAAGAGGSGGIAALQPAFVRLTQAEYRATVVAAFGIDPSLALVPVDGRTGPFTSNASISPDPVHPYLLAGEDIATELVPAELPACPSSDVEACLEDNYRAPLERLFRRPLTSTDMTAFSAMVTELTSVGASAEEATRALLAAAMLSPDFVFRASPVAGETARPRRLAEHLSYALWDAPPDAELAAVGTGPAAELGTRLREQAARLSSDARAVPVLARFVAQWLDVDTDLKLADPEFESSPSFMELIAFVEDALANDRPITSLLAGDRGFVHEDNIDAYGLASPPGTDEVSAITWPADSPRRGLLAEEIFADSTRHPDASRRPIFRGKLVRTALLCDTIPPPDADLLALAEEVGDRTVDPRCAGCHLLMDPIGVTFAALDADFTGTPEPAQVLENAELTGTYPDLPSLLEAVTGTNAFAGCFARHFLSFFLEEPLAAVDPGFVSELAATVQAGGSLRDVLEATVVSLAARSETATPWCEGP